MKKITLLAIPFLILVLLFTSAAGVMAAPPEVKGKPIDVVGKKPIEISGLDYSELIRAGHDPQKARLFEDYTPEHPTTREYSLDTGEHVLIAGGLPHVTSDGAPIDTTWTLNNGSWWGLGADYYESGNNYYRAEVHGTEVKIWSEDGERLFWDPILYIGDRKVDKTVGPVLVDDPTNENYKNNTLKWVYGIWECTRYVRLIEGMVQEWWQFDSDPEEDVRIDHRRSGNYPMCMGSAYDYRGQSLIATVEYLDDEVVKAEEFDKATFPVYVCATATYYSDVCGMLSEWDDSSDGDTWATLRNGDGETGADQCGYGIKWSILVGWQTYPSANLYHNLQRNIFKFDTSSLNDGITVTAASFSLYGYWKDSWFGDDPNVQIYQTTTAFEDDIVWSDYAQISTTALCASPIAYADWTTGDYNTWTLNATGLGEINLTGYTTIGVRNQNYDVANSAPTWANGYWATNIGTYYTPQGSGYEPRLVITYTPDDPEITVEDASEVKGTTARLNSIVLNDGGEGCEVRFGYGTTSQTAANFNNYDTITSWVSTYTEDDHPFVDVSGLSLSTDYYYRVQIKNNTSTQTSAAESMFTTTNAPEPPTDIVWYNPVKDENGEDDATIVSFDWVKGDGATTTEIRYSIDTYPTAVTEGALAANTTHSDYLHEGLAMGTRYYYSFWSHTGGNTSSTYATVLVTTSVSDTGSDGVLEDPLFPAGTFDDPDASGITTRIQNGIYAMADSISMDRDVFAGLMGTLLLVIVGVGSLVLAGTLGMTVMVGIVAVGLGWMGIVPFYIAILFIIAAIALGGFAQARGGAQ